MKKMGITILACIFLISVTGPVLAAPVSSFSDVPARHWAYAAIGKLAKDGIINGYGNGSFSGDKIMTRYEMAQIVANAMTKVNQADAENQAIIQKLSAEFANELDKLDDRITKMDNRVTKLERFTVSGDARLRYIRWSDVPRSGTVQELFRLAITGQVNDDVTMFGRFINMRHTDFGTTDKDDNAIIEAGFKIRNFLGQDGITATVGRFNQMLGASGYVMNMWGVDGGKIAFGNKLQAEIGVADFKNPLTAYTGSALSGQLYFTDAVFASLKYAPGQAVSLQGYYIKNTAGPDTANIWGLGAAVNVGKDFVYKGDHLQNQAYSTQNTADYVRLIYKGSSAAKPRSWGLGAAYKKVYANASLGWGDYNTTSLCPSSNIQNYELSFDYGVAKNIVMKAAQTFDSKNPQTGRKTTNGEWTRVQFDFLF